MEANLGRLRKGLAISINTEQKYLLYDVFEGIFGAADEMLEVLPNALDHKFQKTFLVFQQ